MLSFMYSFDMKNIVPKESLTCLVAKATLDESMLWHRRLGHINFKNINKLVKDNLVRGLPTKRFENDQTCVACLKGKQHRASCKSKVLNPITKPLFMLHMDLFGPTFVSSLMHKKYCLVVTDDYSRFTWVFFLTTKDETSEILKNFIKEIENLVDKKVKIIRSDNGTEFKNKVMDDFCREKGIRREYSVARTPQQNGAEVVSTACYVRNMVLVVKPHNKTPYELFRGFKPALIFMRPFGCHVTILNTLENLGKFDGKSDEGFFVGYSLSSKAFRVYKTRTRRVEENLHIRFLENKPMIEGNGPKWLFDIDSLTQSMNYVPVAAGTISNESAGTQGELNAGTSTQKEEISQDCIVMPIWKDASYFDSPSKDVGNGEPKSAADDQKQDEDGPHNESDEKDKSEDDSSPKEVNAAGQHVNTASPEVNTGSFKLNTVDPSVNTASSYELDSPKDMFKLGASHTLETTHVEFFSDEDEPEVDLGNITNSYTVPTTPNTRIHKDHPIKNVIGDVKSTIQTRRMTKSTSEQGFLSAVYEQKTHDTLNTCLYACFLSQIEPTSIAKALSDSSWVEAMQEELLQFKLQQVWKLMDLPNGKRAIGTKWVFRNKKDERGIVIRNKARLVAQGHRQKEGIDYEEIFAHVARIMAIRLFLAYASFMGFLVYQMDVKSAFFYGTIEEEVYATQPPGFKDPDHLDKVYKVVNALYRLHQAPRAWYETLANYLLGNGFKRGKIDQTLFFLDPMHLFGIFRVSSGCEGSFYMELLKKKRFKRGEREVRLDIVIFKKAKKEISLLLYMFMLMSIIFGLPNMEVYENAFWVTCCMDWGRKLIQLMHTTMVPVQVKTLNDPSKLEYTFKDQVNFIKTFFSLWKQLALSFKSFICVVFVPDDRNIFPEVKGWLDEDLVNYHLKELHCSTQCHTQMSMWIISRGVVLLILLMEYKTKRLQQSKQNLQSSSMTFIHNHRQERLEYMDVHDNDASESSQPSWGKILASTASTLVDLEKPLVKDGDANDVDVHLYRSMIGSLMYLTTSRLDIMFAVCACARFQVTPNTSHLLAIKRIFRYLKGKPTLGLWYLRDSPFELVAYTDSDYARATQDRKSTTGGYHNVVDLLTKGFDARRSWVTEWKRAATTAISLEAEQESGNINKTQFMATLNGSSP
ncbi:putative ribonuclease H-like domain-containing protein [Tanacetum coccineum]